MSADIDIESGVNLPELSLPTLLSARDLTKVVSDDVKGSSIVLELQDIPHEACAEIIDKTHQDGEIKEEVLIEEPKEEEPKEEEPTETDVLLVSGTGSTLSEEKPAEIEKENEILTQASAIHGFKKKRGSTIDVVNCDETTESSETGSISGGHLTSPKDDDVDVVGLATGDGEEDNELFDFREMAAGAMRHAEELVRRMLLHVSWTICHFHALPKWLQDNDFIWQGYRPPLPSFWDCIKSIFSIHTETGNIWTHMLGNFELKKYQLPTG